MSSGWSLVVFDWLTRLRERKICDEPNCARGESSSVISLRALPPLSSVFHSGKEFGLEVFLFRMHRRCRSAQAALDLHL